MPRPESVIAPRTDGALGAHPSTAACLARLLRPCRAAARPSGLVGQLVDTTPTEEEVAMT
jgi:hypothetical protein